MRPGLLALLAATAITGCGGGSPRHGGDGPATSSGTATPADHVEIHSPRDGASVKATSSLPGSNRARLRVTGAANPDATVMLSGGCDFQGCDSIARAGPDGRWTGQVWIFGTAEKPAAIVEAATSTSGGPLARVHLRLHAPRPTRRAAVRRATPSRPRRTRTPQPAAPAAGAAPQPASPVPGTTAVRRLVLVGDSLAEGIEPLMGSLLPGWRVQADALQSRPLATGMAIVGRLDFSVPTALAVSLFTNDDPRNVAGLEAAVRESVRRVGANGCAIWATIVRPPVGGVSYRAANARLAVLQAAPALAGHLAIVPWAEQVAQHSGWIGGDGVHGTPAGYRARAQMYAQAARACGG